MKIAIIGTGYVGLVAGACFADTGNTVICVDKDPRKIKLLLDGKIPIYEPGLEVLVERGSREKRLFFTTNTEDAVRKSDIIFFAVGTPPMPSGEPNLSYLKSAAEEVAKSMNGYKLLVNKSTVPIGSHKTVRSWIEPHTEHDFDVVSNPEFLKEGSAIDDFLKPDRVIIGTSKESVYKTMAELYAPFVRQGNPVIWMDETSAEITKYACNSFLATRISFMNELALLCEKVGGDIESIRKGMATDVRIGKHFLYAGAGYGGSCFPKDVQALISTAKKHDIPMRIVKAAEEANGKQKRHLGEMISLRFGKNLKGIRIGIWGLAFKPNTDDMREAPSLVLIDQLKEMGADVIAFDPVATEVAQSIIGNKIEYAKTSYDAAKNVDALVLVTEWNEFRQVDFDRIKASMKNPILFDGRNIYDPNQMKKMGFEYYAIGRGVLKMPSSQRV
jgi:UDPglucose 6-dehydrogenase